MGMVLKKVRLSSRFPIARRPRATRSLTAPDAPVPTRRPVTDYDVELAAYARLKPDLLRDAPGRFVVFVGETMLGPFDDRVTAHVASLRTFGPVPHYIKQVLDVDPVAYIAAGCERSWC